MKKVLLTIVCGLSLFATDYSTLSLEEMLAKKGTIPEVEREAFRTEMQKRMQTLTPEERQNIKSQYKGNKKGQGNGSGNMYKGSQGNRY